MPPSITITDLASPEEPHQGKRIVRILMHIWHLLTAVLILVTVILGLILNPIRLSILYLIPFAVYDIIYTLCRLFHKCGNRFFLRRQEFGIFAHLRFRAFLYMVAAAIPQDTWGIQEIFTIIIFIFGLVMFILGCIAKEVGFLDWVQDIEKEEGIQLLNSDDEDDVVDILVSSTQAKGARQASQV
ncbi:hypothetical protein FRC19_010625 [Serendipita sp. 401]|nr:hypothetical protein FRC19_010625 [Serendipita sp. 401]KAG9040590.1 hypothetical protein FS842_002966 [Serendipita sp. 407]